jgi:hypothetical protein
VHVEAAAKFLFASGTRAKTSAAMEASFNAHHAAAAQFRPIHAVLSWHL